MPDAPDASGTPGGGTARLLIEYDGTEFSGWARQPGLRTVQAELERALAVVLRHEVGLTVAGRTDAGVHARAQVASHAGRPARADALNALLPNDVAVLESERATDGFNARHDATSRAYCYRVLTRRARSAHERRFALHWPAPVEPAALHACAAALPGTHDFTAFTPTQTDHVRFDRDIHSAWWQVTEGGISEFWIEADAFMRNMIRVLVGTMLEVAGGRGDPDAFAALLTGAPRSAAGRTAPPHGLHFAGAGYGGERLLAPPPRQTATGHMFDTRQG